MKPFVRKSKEELSERLKAQLGGSVQDALARARGKIHEEAESEKRRYEVMKQCIEAIEPEYAKAMKDGGIDKMPKSWTEKLAGMPLTNCKEAEAWRDSWLKALDAAKRL